MEFSSESSFRRVKEVVTIPIVENSLNHPEDSGYLSASQSSDQCSLLSEGTGDFTAIPYQNSPVTVTSNAVTPCSLKPEVNSRGDSFDCMDVDDPLILGIISPQPETQISRYFSQSFSNESSEVWQSTPAVEKLPVNVQEHFDFVTPLPVTTRTVHPTLPSFSTHNPESVDDHSQGDILSRLAKKNGPPPLLKIFSYLDPVDLCQVRLVCRKWRDLVQNSPHLKTWQHFVRARHRNKENSRLTPVKPEEEFESLLSPTTSRSQLREIHNVVRLVQRRPARSPPVSPSKLHSSRYLKEGRKLRRGEKLLKCPKCEWPSHCETYSGPEVNAVSESSMMKGVRCTGPNCQFYFCMDCRSPFHEDSPCPKATPVTPTRPRSRHVKLGSKNSRRNLRRLLM